MTGRQKFVQLQRMLAMKEARLATFKGGSDSYLRADIAALRWAVEVCEPVVLEFPSGPTGRPALTSATDDCAPAVISEKL